MILAIKTADANTHLALYQPGVDEPLAETHWESGRALADQLLERIDSLLAARSKTPGGLTGIVVFSGPGSFTSLRIGHTVANALADSVGIPVAGASGGNWVQAAIEALVSTKPGHPALPEYGSEAHITRPKT